MKIKIWGVRGSVATSTLENFEFGSNTTCVELTTKNNDTIILDAGTGISNLAKKLRNEHREKKEISILLTHSHWDHIQGLTGFDILYDDSWKVNIYAAKNIGGIGLKKVMSNIFDNAHFPVTFEKLSNQMTLHEFNIGKGFKIGETSIDNIAMCHPGGSIGYLIDDGSWSLFFTGDHEISDDDGKLDKFIKDVDVIIADAAYIEKDYQKHIGWGHSSVERWVKKAELANIKHLILTHFCHEYGDVFLTNLQNNLRAENVDKNFQITLAKEGLKIVSPKEAIKNRIGSIPTWLTTFSKTLSSFNNVSTIIDTILLEARSTCQADAGTIYLVENNKLSFEYSQNDTLFNDNGDNKHLYINAKIPIDNTSIAGFVANNAITLNIDDVYRLSADLPYSFNKLFDISSSYKTVSMLTVPFIGNNTKVIGVMQLINCKIGDEIIPFTKEMEERIQLLCIIAANAVQKGQLSTELIMRMLKMSSLNDPKETGTHVRRVGAVASELYLKWAKANDIDIDTQKSFQDNLRLAAMLHDVGKVGISDVIIKKPGKLDQEERRMMEQHCIMGAELFINADSAVDIMSREIAQHHHQKWDGTGYTGSPYVATLSGKDIPLSARITTVADVYDALISRRSYKEAWSEIEALDILKKDAGSHFDPEIVKYFIEIMPTIRAIYQKYAE